MKYLRVWLHCWWNVHRMKRDIIKTDSQWFCFDCARQRELTHLQAMKIIEVAASVAFRIFTTYPTLKDSLKNEVDKK